MEPRIAVWTEKGLKTYTSFNELVDENEVDIRAYLACKDASNVKAQNTNDDFRSLGIEVRIIE